MINTTHCAVAKGSRNKLPRNTKRKINRIREQEKRRNRQRPLTRERTADDE